jgi:hypothetical protein
MSYRMIYTLRRLMYDKFSILCTYSELNAKQLREDNPKACNACTKCTGKCYGKKEID